MPHRLLVVDDEPHLRELYEMDLVRQGHDVDTAGSVAEAWEHLTEHDYQLVLTDMRLPDGTGLELVRRLEAGGRGEVVIVITAYGSAENAVEALKAGAFDYLTKPVDWKQFRSVVALALAPQAHRPSGPRGSARSEPAPAASPGAGSPPSASASASARPSAAAASPGAGRAEAAGGTPTFDSTQEVALHPSLARLVGRSAAMAQVRGLIERVSRGMAPVLVQGESGTGKELVARALHGLSPRADRPFIAVNCGAIPETLLEAEFFGHRKGAFTGAGEDRPGFFQAAQEGTLFLDEIGDLPLAMQSKLLRAIQERAVRPVGATAEVPVNVRLVSATHKDLALEVQEGRFRQDLFYRLNVIPIRMPALRERLDDLADLAAAALARMAAEAGVSPAPRLAAEALQRLGQHRFPGNVRELENLLLRAVTLSGGEVIEACDLGLPAEESDWMGLAAETAVVKAERATERPSITPITPVSPGHTLPPPAEAAARLPDDLVAYLDQVEREVLQRALERHRYNRTAAGAALGLTLRQMRYRMARLGIQAPDSPAEGG